MIRLSESKVDKRQLKALLRAAFKTDLRGASNPLDTSGNKSRKFPPILGVVIMKGLIGVGLGAFTLFVADPFLTSFFVYSTMSVFLAISVLMEFSNLILNPEEYQIVATRPIGSKTFFAAKLIHLLTYVNTLGAVIYLPSSITVSIANSNPILFLSFSLSGLLAATAVGMTFVLVYTLMLRIVNRETMQRALGYAQLVLIVIIYFGYFVVPRMFGRESLAMFRDFHSDWLYTIPSSWYAAIAKFPAGGLTSFDLMAAAAGVVSLIVVFRAALSRLSIRYAQTLSETVNEQQQQVSSRKRGFLARLMGLYSTHEDRAVWSLIRKQFKYDNRFKMSVLTIIPLSALYVYLGVADGNTMANPFVLLAEGEKAGSNYLLYVAVAMLPFMIVMGTANSESYRSAWVFYTSPADRSRVVLASTRFALVYFCLPFTVLLLGLFTWFFGVFIHALLHCVIVFVLLMILTKLMVVVYPRVPFSQPTKAGQKSVALYTMLFVAMPVMVAPMVVISYVGYGGYTGYLVWLVAVLGTNYLLSLVLKKTIPGRVAKLEFTASV